MCWSMLRLQSDLECTRPFSTRRCSRKQRYLTGRYSRCTLHIRLKPLVNEWPQILILQEIPSGRVSAYGSPTFVLILNESHSFAKLVCQHPLQIFFLGTHLSIPTCPACRSHAEIIVVCVRTFTGRSIQVGVLGKERYATVHHLMDTTEEQEAIMWPWQAMRFVFKDRELLPEDKLVDTGNVHGTSVDMVLPVARFLGQWEALSACRSDVLDDNSWRPLPSDPLKGFTHCGRCHNALSRCWLAWRYHYINE